MVKQAVRFSEESGRRERFNANFGHQALKILNRFVNNLQQDESEVLMFTARKAACLGDSLRLAQLWTPHSVVCSDKALDLDSAWLRGKSITIVDDLVGTGASLDRLVGRLDRVSPKSSLSVLTMATRPEWPNALNALASRHPEVNLKPAPVLSSATDSIRENITSAIAAVPRPYNLDWPLLAGWELSLEELDALVVQSRWVSRETTSPLQLEHGVRVVTLEPLADDLVRFVASIPAPHSTIGLAKVRLYLEPTHGQKFRVAVMPIVAFDRLAVSDLTDLTEHFSLGKALLASGSRQGVGRLLQYYCSLKLAEIFQHECRFVTCGKRLAESRWQLSLGFSPKFSHRMLGPDLGNADSVGSADQVAGLTKNATRTVVQVRKAQEEERFAAFTLYEYLYRESKLGARRLARDKAKLSEPASMVLFLEQDHEQPAFSVSDLVAILENLGTDASPQALVSGFLDEAIDNGHTVPIVIERDGALCRVYRAGESIEFAMREQRLFSVMIREALLTAPNLSIGKILLEKMLILAVRYGAERAPLLKPINSPNGLPSLTIAYSRYGSIGTLDPNALELPIASSSTHTLGSELSRLDVIKWAPLQSRSGRPQPNKYRVELGTAALDTTSPADEAQFERLGGLVGKLLSSAVLTVPEFELFVILCNGEQVPLALGAEVGLVKRGLAGLISPLKQLPQAPTLLDRNLRGSNEWILALESALEKVEGITSGVVEAVTQKALAGLDRSGQIDWRDISSTVVSPVSSEEGQRLQHEMQWWLVRAAAFAFVLRARYRQSPTAKSRANRSNVTELSQRLHRKTQMEELLNRLERLSAEELANELRALADEGDSLFEEMTVNHDAAVVGERPLRYEQVLLVVSKHDVPMRERNAFVDNVLSRLKPGHVPLTHPLTPALVGQRCVGFAVDGGAISDVAAHVMPFVQDWLRKNSGSVVLVTKLGSSRRLLRSRLNMYWHGAGFQALCRELPRKCDELAWPEIVIGRGQD